jgi:hypothetical protein
MCELAFIVGHPHYNGCYFASKVLPLPVSTVTTINLTLSLSLLLFELCGLLFWEDSNALKILTERMS